MKTLPAFQNCDICDFMISLTNYCVDSYQIDVAYDVADLYNIVLRGYKTLYWGIRKVGTGMGSENSEILDFYKKNNMILLFRFTDMRIEKNKLRGDVQMISYTEKFNNKWYNEVNSDGPWYHAGDDFDEFFSECKKTARDFLRHAKE